MPHGIFAVGIGIAVLPSLSGKFATGEYEEYKTLLMKALTSVLFFAIPSAAGFLVLREQLVRAVFKWGGRFTEENVPFVAEILAFFCLAMITHSTVTIMNRAFYAAQDTRTPLAAGLVSVILNLALGYVFYRHTDLGAAGMALSYSLISLVNSFILLVLNVKKLKGRCRRTGGFPPQGCHVSCGHECRALGYPGNSALSWRSITTGVPRIGDHRGMRSLSGDDAASEVAGSDIFGE